MCISSLGRASQNITVLDEAKLQLTKYGDFIHHLTLFALVSVKSYKVQGTEAQHAKAMVQATTYIFQSLSKARSTSLGVLNANALLSGPRVAGLHQNTWGWSLQRGQLVCCLVTVDRALHQQV